MTTQREPLILASQSPRRAALLRQIDVTFAIQPAAGPEPPPQEGEAATAYALRTASHKAAQVQSDRIAAGVEDAATSWVIGADTIVVIDGQILGKPGSTEEAVAMLTRLSGRAHQVITAYAIVQQARGIATAAHTSTDVWFRELRLAHIDAYVATGEPMDKAGAYGIQGRAALFVERIEGCYFNVVGLPLGDLMATLGSLGYGSPLS